MSKLHLLKVFIEYFWCVNTALALPWHKFIVHCAFLSVIGIGHGHTEYVTGLSFGYFSSRYPMKIYFGGLYVSRCSN